MTADIVQLNPDMAPELGSDERALIVDVEGFEGPLDLLLTLARQQKVDLAKISILALADQYLVFIEQARRLRLELAADYLVMAAWLAYLKSRLLLPDAPGAEGLSAAEMANALALRLKQLEAIRAMAQKLFDRHQLGRHVFGRGDPEPIAEIKHPKWSATLYDLLSAYATERQRHVLARVRFAKRAVWSLAEARSALEPSMRATVFASSLAAALELVREGRVEVNQQKAFGPIYLRKRGEAATPSPSTQDTSMSDVRE
jgi:segregation and condensation protein A